MAGRTGRMGKKGIVVTLAETSEKRKLLQVEQALKIKFKYLSDFSVLDPNNRGSEPAGEGGEGWREGGGAAGELWDEEGLEEEPEGEAEEEEVDWK